MLLRPSLPRSYLSAVRLRFRPTAKPLSCTTNFVLALLSAPIHRSLGLDVVLHGRHARSEYFSQADVEPPRSIGAPGAAGIADVRHTPDIRVDVERAADPGFGEVAQASPSDAMHPPAAVAAESVEPSRPIGASVAVDIVNIRQRSAVRGGVGLAANPVVGEAAQSSSYDANHPPVAVATESMAPSRPIGAPDAAGIADVRQSQHGRSGVELVAGPVSGEAAQVSLSNLQLLLVAVATESVEPSRRIGAPDAADIEDGRQSLTVRGDVGLAADPTVGEAAQSSSSDASHPPVAVTTTSNPMMSICVGYKPDDEVGGASPVDPPGSFSDQAVYFHVGQRSCLVA